MPTLEERAQQIRNETIAAANTAERVGSLLEDMVAQDEANYNELSAKSGNLKVCSRYKGFFEYDGYNMEVVQESNILANTTALVLDAIDIETEEVFRIKDKDTLRFYVPLVLGIGSTSGDVAETYKENQVYIRLFDDVTEETRIIQIARNESDSDTNSLRVKHVYSKMFDVSVGRGSDGQLRAMLIGELETDNITEPIVLDDSPILITVTEPTYTIVGDESSSKLANSAIDGGEIILGDISAETSEFGTIITIQSGSNAD